MDNTSLPPDELERLAIDRFGPHWPSKLAAALGVSRPAVSRWRKEGIASPDRAAQVRDTIEHGHYTPKPAVEIPSPEEFRAWRARNLGSLNAAATKLGLNVDTIRALETGVTRKGFPAPIPIWVAYMMLGYDRSRSQVDADTIAAIATIAVAACANQPARWLPRSQRRRRGVLHG